MKAVEGWAAARAAAARAVAARVVAAREAVDLYAKKEIVKSLRLVR